MSLQDDPKKRSEEAALYDVSELSELSDEDLLDRRRQLGEIEREAFHRNLNARSFMGHAGHLENEPLEEARWAMDGEIKQRGLN